MKISSIPPEFCPLFHHNLLHFHILAVDEAEQVDSRSGFDLLGAVAVDFFAAQDAAVDINHLENGIAFVADDPAAILVLGQGWFLG